MKRIFIALLVAHLFGAHNLFAQTDVQTTGSCSPVFVHSVITGTISVSCDNGDRSLASIAEALNTLASRSHLQTSQINELIGLMNSILSLRPQLERIESTARTSQSISSETLSILRRLIDERRDGGSVIGTIRGVEAGIRRRVVRLPERIDPQDFTARISFITLNDVSGCPLLSSNVPQSLPQNYRQMIANGNDLARRHFYNEAIEYYRQAASLLPREVAAYFKTAEALCESRDYPRALALLDQTLSLRSRQSELNIAKGQLQFRLRQFREASRTFHLARSQNPNEASVAFAEGQSLRRAGDCQPAVSAFTAAIELDPRYVEAYLSRAECRLTLNAPTLAVADFSTVLALDENNVEARVRLAHTYRVLASNRAYSSQADYRHFADREDSRAAELQRSIQERTRLEAPALSCTETTLPSSEATNPCSVRTYYISFDRGRSHLNQSNRGELERVAEAARPCARTIVRLFGYADVGEDDFSNGIDLAASRSNFVFFALTSLIGRPGINSLTAVAPNEFIIRTGDDDGNGLIGVFQSVRGYEGRPIQAGQRPDERNQVVRANLICEP